MNLNKLITLIISLILLLSIQSVIQCIGVSNNKIDIKQNPSNFIPYRNKLKPNDEGPHYNRLLPMREWWYYNVVFDKTNTDLKNWSAMISFNHLCKTFDDPDMLFISLYDNNNETYGGMINKKDRTMQAEGPGVNVSYENSWVRGQYPSWKVYVEDNNADENHDIIIELNFEALSLPYWVWMNTGHGSTNSPIGYYSINHCYVYGKIWIDGIIYNVNGTGYHDHTWALFMLGGSSVVWDWFTIHFDNGLHAFIWQIIPISKFDIPLSNLGFGWITDGEKFTNFKLFRLEYIELSNTSIPGFSRPKLFRLSSYFFGAKLQLNLQTKNMHEYLWGEIPFVKIALWEGSCSAVGSISTNLGLVELKGTGIAEILRIIT
jgi:predicted secreted hydrolase